MIQSHKLHLINELSNIAGITYLTEEQAYEVHPSYKGMNIDDLNREVRESWQVSRSAGYFDFALPRTCSERQFATESWRHDPHTSMTTAQRRKIFGAYSPEEMDESYQLAANNCLPVDPDELPF